MFLTIMMLLLNLFMLYIMSVLPWLFLYSLVRHEKSFRQFLKEVKYIPIIPFVNILVLLAVLIYQVYLDFKNKKETRLGYSIGSAVAIITFVLLLTTYKWYWVFLIPFYSIIWEIVDAKKKLKGENK